MKDKMNGSRYKTKEVAALEKNTKNGIAVLMAVKEKWGLRFEEAVILLRMFGESFAGNQTFNVNIGAALLKVSTSQVRRYLRNLESKSLKENLVKAHRGKGGDGVQPVEGITEQSFRDIVSLMAELKENGRI
jgi:hypothetical protein